MHGCTLPGEGALLCITLTQPLLGFPLRSPVRVACQNRLEALPISPATVQNSPEELAVLGPEILTVWRRDWMPPPFRLLGRGVL